MTFQMRVVPKKKRRGSPGQPMAENSETAICGNWLDAPEEAREKNPFSLSAGIRAELAKIISPLTYAKGSVLFFEGEDAPGVFVVEAGRIKLSADSADGRSLLLRIAEIDDIVGLPAAISGERSEVTAEAISPARCGFIARECFLAFLAAHGTFALRVAEILAQSYQATLHQVRCLGFSASTEEKFARFLLDWPQAQPPDGGPWPVVRMTHREIGAMIGSSRETVTRMVARFKREQLVATDGSELRVMDRDRLQQILLRRS